MLERLTENVKHSLLSVDESVLIGIETHCLVVSPSMVSEPVVDV